MSEWKGKMESYIIRIYRRDEQNPQNIIGLVEDVGLEAKTPFHNVEELIHILIGKYTESKQGWRRKNNRLKLRLPVRIEGIDAMGDKFTEEAAIKNISSYGAYISMKNHVSKDTGVSLIIDPENSCLNMKARVVRIEKKKDANGVGVAFLS